MATELSQETLLEIFSLVYQSYLPTIDYNPRWPKEHWEPLASLCLVCRSWLPLAHSVLYRRVGSGEKETLQKLCTTFDAKPGHALLVKEIDIPGAGKAENLPLTELQLSLVSRCPNLRIARIAPLSNSAPSKDPLVDILKTRKLEQVTVFPPTDNNYLSSTFRSSGEVFVGPWTEKTIIEMVVQFPSLSKLRVYGDFSKIEDGFQFGYLPAKGDLPKPSPSTSLKVLSLSDLNLLNMDFHNLLKAANIETLVLNPVIASCDTLGIVLKTVRHNLRQFYFEPFYEPEFEMFSPAKQKGFLNSLRHCYKLRQLSIVGQVSFDLKHFFICIPSSLQKCHIFQYEQIVSTSEWQSFAQKVLTGSELQEVHLWSQDACHSGFGFYTSYDDVLEQNGQEGKADQGPSEEAVELAWQERGIKTVFRPVPQKGYIERGVPFPADLGYLV